MTLDRIERHAEELQEQSIDASQCGLKLKEIEKKYDGDLNDEATLTDYRKSRQILEVKLTVNKMQAEHFALGKLLREAGFVSEPDDSGMITRIKFTYNPEVANDE